MRVRTRLIEGDAAAWDPADPEPFLRLAAPRFLRAEGDCALVTTGEGSVVSVRPGWLAIVPDGARPGEVHFTPGINLGDAPHCEWERA